MGLKAYFLKGVDDDSILVFRSDDSETLFRLISRLAASRDREIRGIAKKLEIEWFERTYKEKE